MTTTPRLSDPWRQMLTGSDATNIAVDRANMLQFLDSIDAVAREYEIFWRKWVDIRKVGDALKGEAGRKITGTTSPTEQQELEELFTSWAAARDRVTFLRRGNPATPMQESMKGSTRQNVSIVVADFVTLLNEVDELESGRDALTERCSLLVQVGNLLQGKAGPDLTGQPTTVRNIAGTDSLITGMRPKTAGTVHGLL